MVSKDEPNCHVHRALLRPVRQHNGGSPSPHSAGVPSKRIMKPFVFVLMPFDGAFDDVYWRSGAPARLLAPTVNA